MEQIDNVKSFNKTKTLMEFMNETGARIISKDEDESSVNSFSDEQSSDAETNQESLLNIKTLKVD